MSRRVSNPAGHRTTVELVKRESTASQVDGLTPGPPPRPQFFGPSKERTYWLHLEGYLSAKRLLAVQDGDAVAEWVAAKLRGDTSAAKAIVNAVWSRRTPFPDTRPEAPAITMEAFLSKVKAGRDSFTARMSPERTVCFDWDKSGTQFFEYQWAEDDPAGVARLYAQQVLAGTILAGDLLIRAARRFITDIETGSSRGLFFDPLAARHVVRFAEVLCGLKLMPWQIFCLSNIFRMEAPERRAAFHRGVAFLCKKERQDGTRRNCCLVGLNRRW